jgi:plastocyanin
MTGVRIPAGALAKFSYWSGAVATSEPGRFCFTGSISERMRRGQLTRRQAITAVVGIGFGTTASGCSETGSTSGDSTSQESTTQSASPTSERSTAATETDTRTETSTEMTGGTETGAGTPGNASERGAHTIGMYTDLYFDPIGLFVEPGETVSFELVSGVHSAAAYHPDNEGVFERRVPEGTPAWDTGVFDTPDAFRNVTFETRGTHDYYCLPHKQLGMVGRIVVGEPGGPASNSPNPDGELPDSKRIVEQGSIAYEAFRSGG